ncbi:S23 ribosomal protein [Riemerella anatipestifer]|uniref:S23 ribosomal protein n=1 Tax=Riemerella anatipestifer TaxID=34085 RepID=A0A1S7DRD1_RIEAN|nr:S23 ribosomal protein [Riemerella anatipestifer]
MFYFEKLEVWQNARKFTVNIYRVTECLPNEEKFGIVSQMRRAL